MTTPDFPVDSEPTQTRGRHAKSRVRSSSARKRRRWIKALVISLSSLVIIGLALGGAGWFYANYRLDQIPRVKNVKGLTAVKPGAPFNVLIIGSDSRVGIPADQTVHYGGTVGPDAVTGQRSDTLIVMRVIPATHGIEMLSIPRDTWVNLPGVGQQNRVNAALNWGPSELIRTVEDDFHIPISHFAYTTFPGFTDAVTALGGIYLNFPDPVKDDETGLRITKTGCQLLKGTQALAYVRSRDLYYYANGQWNYDGLGDLSRIRRQQVFFHEAIDRLEAAWNPINLNDFLANMVKNITLDSGFSNSDLITLAREFHNVPSSALQTEVIPTSGAVIDGSDVLLPVWRYDDLMIRDFLADGVPKTTKSSSTSTTTASTSTTTTTTQPVEVTGTTTVPIFDTSKNYPEPWNPTPCSP